MKLQFSLATLLVCMTVLAVVCTIAISVPVHEKEFGITPPPPAGSPRGPYVWIELPETHPPTASAIASRLALWGPPAVAATLGVLWTIRRLKSRRENGPPVG
jgi:hypothetical protein